MTMFQFIQDHGTEISVTTSTIRLMVDIGREGWSLFRYLAKRRNERAEKSVLTDLEV